MNWLALLLRYILTVLIWNLLTLLFCHCAAFLFWDFIANLFWNILTVIVWNLLEFLFLNISTLVIGIIVTCSRNGCPHLIVSSAFPLIFAVLKLNSLLMNQWCPSRFHNWTSYIYHLHARYVNNRHHIIYIQKFSYLFIVCITFCFCVIFYFFLIFLAALLLVLSCAFILVNLVTLLSLDRIALFLVGCGALGNTDGGALLRLCLHVLGVPHHLLLCSACHRL